MFIRLLECLILFHVFNTSLSTSSSPPPYYELNAINLPISFNYNNEDITKQFVIKYKDLHQWKDIVNEFSITFQLDQQRLHDAVYERLTALKYDLSSNINDSTESEDDYDSLDQEQFIDSLNASLQSLLSITSPLSSSCNSSSNHSVEDAMPCLSDTERVTSYYDLFATSTRYHDSSNPFKLANTLHSLSLILEDDDQINDNDDDDKSQQQHQQDDFPLYIDYFKQYFTTSSSSSSSALLSAESHAPRIFIYQASTGRTGGTVALDILQEMVTTLGYPIIYCDLLQPTHLRSVECTQPRSVDIVMTGEWCHALSDFKLIHKFHGRGIQYHLGFHHYNDFCPGFVTVTDSHYLAVVLERRILSGVYLGCPMTHSIHNAMKAMYEGVDIDSLKQTILNSQTHIHNHTHYNDSTYTTSFISRVSRRNTNSGTTTNNSNHNSINSNRRTRVRKENLIVIDPDISTDYPPSTPLTISLPADCDDCKVVYAKGIPHELMQLLLQRAKVVLDLAMPGPERLAGEGVLMGATPILSSRWNGGSGVDFPNVLKVDHQNATQINEAIKTVLSTYNSNNNNKNEHKNENHLQKPNKNGEFFQYIISLKRKLKHTADLYFGSIYLHFVISATTLQEEYNMIFQIMCLLYLHPLATITVFVSDVLWFIRHHYAFYSELKTAGYIRVDVFDPVNIDTDDTDTVPPTQQPQQQEQQQQQQQREKVSSSRSYVRFMSISDLQNALLHDIAATAAASNTHVSDTTTSTTAAATVVIETTTDDTAAAIMTDNSATAVNTETESSDNSAVPTAGAINEETLSAIEISDNNSNNGINSSSGSAGHRFKPSVSSSSKLLRLLHDSSSSSSSSWSSSSIIVLQTGVIPRDSHSLLRFLQSASSLAESECEGEYDKCQQQCQQQCQSSSTTYQPTARTAAAVVGTDTICTNTNINYTTRNKVTNNLTTAYLLHTNLNSDTACDIWRKVETVQTILHVSLPAAAADTAAAAVYESMNCVDDEFKDCHIWCPITDRHVVDTEEYSQTTVTVTELESVTVTELESVTVTSAAETESSVHSNDASTNMCNASSSSSASSDQESTTKTEAEDNESLFISLQQLFQCQINRHNKYTATNNDNDTIRKRSNHSHKNSLGVEGVMDTILWKSVLSKIDQLETSFHPCDYDND